MQIRLDKTKGAPYNKDCEQIGNVSRRLFSTANFPAANGMGTAAGNALSCRYNPSKSYFIKTGGTNMKVAIFGAGTMGSGIAQVFAAKGHTALICKLRRFRSEA